jgi:23S rRNA (pseudouridine1915-N3)-methyltransferase
LYWFRGFLSPLSTIFRGDEETTMQIELAAVTGRGPRGKNEPTQTLAADYIARAQRLNPTQSLRFESEALLLASAERSTGQAGRAAATLWLFDARGDLVTSDELAQAVGRLRDAGTQRLLCAIGPADGWSATALDRAQRKISLGRMTLPHELARAVAAEQIYRCLTILAGHPYHTAH